MYRLLLAILIITFYACENREEPKSGTYLAGEIVNPTSRHVKLFKGEEVIDSVPLNAQNRFEFRLDSIEEGLYNFSHDPEFQYVYLEKGDSIQLRLNTMAFDESLTYSGTGEVVNNFMINLYLEREREDEVIKKSFIQLEPEVFAYKMDSLVDKQLNELNQLQGENDISEPAYDLVKASILYRSYFYRESYPFWHKKESADKTLHSLPKDFYDYRNSISYNNPQLTYLRPYYEFMKYHIGNLAYMGCRKSCSDMKGTISNQLHFNRHQLKLIDSLVKQETLRDNLFRTVAFDYLLKNDSDENYALFMEDFHNLSGNNRHLQEINDLSEGIRSLRPDNELPDLNLYNTLGEEVSLRDISKNDEVVFYFWTGPQPRHLKNITRRVRDLEKIHKDHRFIGICIRTGKEQWETQLKSHGLNPENQFWAKDYNTLTHRLVVNNPYKVIIVRDGRIIDGFANLNTSF
ncbi:TlpA family protein disulfide reductase [Robiginitalea sp. IMCC44478]|uniref:TlpA family protein disulfide reductase n=1 Tax=Robiginitalea sp. IMCC44478 TaxID=3459122 RepID=UPI004042C5F6